jgi:hypothetical protein
MSRDPTFAAARSTQPFATMPLDLNSDIAFDRSGVDVHAFQRGAVPLQTLGHAAKHDVDGAYMMEQLTSNGYSVRSGMLQPIAHQAQGYEVF